MIRGSRVRIAPDNDTESMTRVLTMALRGMVLRAKTHMLAGNAAWTDVGDALSAAIPPTTPIMSAAQLRPIITDQIRLSAEPYSVSKATSKG
jgi:hypothetical protein